MKVFTSTTIAEKDTFAFWGNGDALNVGDIVYLWQMRSGESVRQEVIYGTAEVKKILQTNRYEAIRIA
jgi:hypothetical protein